MNRPWAVLSSTTQYRSPQSSIFSSASVPLVLIVWLFHETKGSGDATKVTEPLAPNSKERIRRSVHGQGVMQLMPFHHLLGSAWRVLQTSALIDFLASLRNGGETALWGSFCCSFQLLEEFCIGLFLNTGWTRSVCLLPFLLMPLLMHFGLLLCVLFVPFFFSERRRPNLYAVFKTMVSLICVRTYFSYYSLFLFSVSQQLYFPVFNMKWADIFIELSRETEFFFLKGYD